jgi:hypothetical protein
MIVEILKQVIMRLDIRDIPGAVNIYSRLLKEITQIKPLIEPETAMLAIQHDGGIQSIVRLFD